MANPPEVSQLDLRGLGPEELATILSGGINIGKIRADQVQAQQQAELENVRNLILQQQAVAKEKKDEAYQKYLDGESTRKEAADAARAADQDADRKVDMLRADAAMTAALRPSGSSSMGTTVKLADGTYARVDAQGNHVALPGVPVSENPTDSSTSAQMATADTLRKYHEGIVGKGKDEGQPYADMINKFDPNWTYEWKETPGRFYGTNGAWTKVPKSPATTQSTGNAPASAVEYLRKNPQLKDQFKLKYGYLPEGI